MFTVTTADQDELDFNFEHDHTGRVTGCWDDDGNDLRVTKRQYARACEFARQSIRGMAYHLDSMIAESRTN